MILNMGGVLRLQPQKLMAKRARRQARLKDKQDLWETDVRKGKGSAAFIFKLKCNYLPSVHSSLRLSNDTVDWDAINLSLSDKSQMYKLWHRKQCSARCGTGNNLKHW